MTTRLCWWPAENGDRVELHFDRARKFWTERKGDLGTGLVLVDTFRAQEHYEYAAHCGHVDRAFPFAYKLVA